MMLAPETVYVVVLSDAATVLACRYIESPRIGAWLDGMAAEVCLVYDDPPSKGGSLLRTLRPDHRSHRWLETTAG